LAGSADALAAQAVARIAARLHRVTNIESSPKLLSERYHLEKMTEDPPEIKWPFNGHLAGLLQVWD
jgi:hypothetical protein